MEVQLIAGWNVCDGSQRFEWYNSWLIHLYDSNLDISKYGHQIKIPPMNSRRSLFGMVSVTNDLFVSRAGNTMEMNCDDVLPIIFIGNAIKD